MKYFALFYYVVDNFVSRRAPFREEHLRLAAEAARHGRLLLAGAMGDPADRALLVFSGEDEGVAKEFADNDPYVKNGLVSRWEVLPWNVVVGSLYTVDGGNTK